MIEFKGWPKIARLYRDIVITEKLDGTNGAIGIQEFPFGWHVGGVDEQGVSHELPENVRFIMGPVGDDWLPTYEYLVYAQSRNAIITPARDNHGFARWVWDNAEILVQTLGTGLHYGEWWGSGINRGYNLVNPEKRFSLFNTSRWSRESFDIDKQCEYIPRELDVVPILYQGAFSTVTIKAAKLDLQLHGSYAAPGYLNPEGIVVYHTAGNVMFKSTLYNDDQPKEVAAKRNLRLAT